MKIVGLYAEHVVDLWPALKPRFESFAERGHWSAHELLTDVVNKKRQCWIAYDEGVKAVALTDVENEIVTITHCAGEGREDWQTALVEEIEKWTKHIGAKRVTAYCRPGWTPMLKGLGYRETHRILERDIG